MTKTDTQANQPVSSSPEVRANVVVQKGDGTAVQAVVQTDVLMVVMLTVLVALGVVTAALYVVLIAIRLISNPNKKSRNPNN